MSYIAHQKAAKDTPVRCAILTISDTRTEETDTSGALMRQLLEEAGHEVVSKRIIPDEPDRIEALVQELAQNASCILTNGGTGISPRDTTFEVLERMIDKPLPGFGELFRMLSYEEIGAGAMLSRATAGLMGPTLIFSTPGSRNAVRLAMEKLILPELRHLVWESVK